MNMCKKEILRIYLDHVSNGGNVIGYFEKSFISSEHDEPISFGSESERRKVYENLFSESCQSVLGEVYSDLVRQIRDVDFDSAVDLISAFSFLQLMLATGLWKYKMQIPSGLEIFVRDFDRLDDESERLRLYRSIGVAEEK